MIADGSSVWCSLENSPLLVKVDVGLKKLVQVLTICWNSIYETAKKNNFYEITPDFHFVPDNANISRGRSKSTSVIAGPPLPPRRQPVLFKDCDMSGLNELKPPIVPKRSSCCELDVSITSLMLSTDVLIIGTSSGGMVLLPLTYNSSSDMSGCPPALPFQLPILRHPTQKTNLNSGQCLTSTGSISILTLANDKLVSLHTSNNQVIQLRRSKSSYNKHKRMGRLITTESLQEFNTLCQLEEGDNSKIQSALTSNSATAKSDSLMPAVTDIAVWDKITWSRLSAIRFYTHSLSSCSGWCCRAPTSADVVP
uniref:Uncharacterized protein n=1 Tax=Arion vulgaris TaxID=1028688 RepID=A0A0B7ATV8_9EUPU